jgi:hypothetical protein
VGGVAYDRGGRSGMAGRGPVSGGTVVTRGDCGWGYPWFGVPESCGLSVRLGTDGAVVNRPY